MPPVSPGYAPTESAEARSGRYMNARIDPVVAGEHGLDSGDTRAAHDQGEGLGGCCS